MGSPILFCSLYDKLFINNIVKWSTQGAWRVPDMVQISRKDLIV